MMRQLSSALIKNQSNLSSQSSLPSLSSLPVLSSLSLWGRRSCRLPFPSTRPNPFFLPFNQSSRHRIPLDILNNSPKLIPVANPMIVGLILPESCTGQPKQHIGSPCGSPLQPAHNLGERVPRRHDDVHMVGHDDPGMQLVELSDRLSIEQSIFHDFCDAGLAQPARTFAGAVQLRI